MFANPVSHFAVDPANPQGSSSTASKARSVVTKVGVSAAILSPLLIPPPQRRLATWIFAAVGAVSFGYDQFFKVRETSGLHGQIAEKNREISDKNEQIADQTALVNTQVEANRTRALAQYTLLHTQGLIPENDPIFALENRLRTALPEETNRLTLLFHNHLKRLNETLYQEVNTLRTALRNRVDQIIENPELRNEFLAQLEAATQARLVELETRNRQLEQDKAALMAELQAHKSELLELKNTVQLLSKANEENSKDIAELKKLCGSLIAENKGLKLQVKELEQSRLTPEDRKALDDVQSRLRAAVNFDLPEVQKAAMNLALGEELT